MDMSLRQMNDGRWVIDGMSVMSSIGWVWETLDDAVEDMEALGYAVVDDPDGCYLVIRGES